MNAPTPIHRCLHTLWSVNRWVCVSECHKGQTVDLPAPGLKPGTHGFRYTETAR